MKCRGEVCHADLGALEKAYLATMIGGNVAERRKMGYQLLHEPDSASLRLLDGMHKLTIIHLQEDVPDLLRVLDATL